MQNAPQPYKPAPQLANHAIFRSLLNLRATGGLGQGAVSQTQPLTVSTLTGAASASWSFSNPANRITALGDISAPTISVSNGESLSVAGTVAGPAGLTRSLRRLRRSSFGGTGLEALIKLADCVHTRGLRRRELGVIRCAMFIDVVPNGRSASAVLLRESYREGSKVRKRTLANLGKLPPTVVDRLRVLLQGGTVVARPEEVFESSDRCRMAMSPR